MANTVDSYRNRYAEAVKNDDGALLKQTVIGDMPAGVDGTAMVNDIVGEFALEEAAEVCAELVATLTASCTEDDFHNWDYDHIEFIIDLSNRYRFTIPRNLLNGLPEQLILLVDAKKLSEPGCD